MTDRNIPTSDHLLPRTGYCPVFTRLWVSLPVSDKTLIIILELTTIEVARRAKFIDLFLAHLFPGGF